MTTTNKAASRLRMALKVLLGIVVVFLVGDFAYSRYVAARHRQWEESIKRNENGVRVGCEECCHGEGSTALLLIHGINDSPHFYYKMAPALADAGFHCEVMRLPGFAEPSDNYATKTKEDWVESVADAAARLRESHDRVCIIAHSLGGAITINHLLDHPGSADRVVLLAPALDVANDRSPVLPTRAWHEISRYTLLFTDLTESPFGVDARDPEEAASQFRTPYTPRAVIRETFQLFDANRDRGDEFQVPMLLVLGAHDSVIDAKAARKFYEAAPCTPKQIYEMPDAAHALAVDYGWEELTNEIIAFVGSQEAAEQVAQPSAS